MPFKSKAQMRYMFMAHPEMAKQWEDKYGISKNLPEHKAKTKKLAKKKKKYNFAKAKKKLGVVS